jgi:hypothetical protein
MAVQIKKNLWKTVQNPRPILLLLNSSFTITRKRRVINKLLLSICCSLIISFTNSTIWSDRKEGKFCAGKVSGGRRNYDENKTFSLEIKQ